MTLLYSNLFVIKRDDVWTPAPTQVDLGTAKRRNRGSHSVTPLVKCPEQTTTHTEKKQVSGWQGRGERGEVSVCQWYGVSFWSDKILQLVWPWLHSCGYSRNHCTLPICVWSQASGCTAVISAPGKLRSARGTKQDPGAKKWGRGESSGGTCYRGPTSVSAPTWWLTSTCRGPDVLI